MLYTIIGLMIILMVSYAMLHIIKMTYRPNTADLLVTHRFSTAAYGLQAEMQTMTRYSVYPALWAVGHRMEGDKNYYLTLSEEEGIEAIGEDISKDVATRLNGYMLSASENQTIPYKIYVDEIPFTVEPISSGDITVNESENGMTFSVKIPVKTQYKDIRYKDTPTINVELPTRIIDMYKRAKKFDNEYESNVQWATTIALYMRAYANGYNPEYEGSYLREGHIAYDPIDTLLRADLKAFKNLSINSITGVGSVPMATWLTEWNTLGEPSFLPPSTDFDMNLPGSEKIINMIKDGYDIEKAANCSSLTGENRTECDDFNDPDKIGTKKAELETQKTDLENLAGQIRRWTHI
jgi:hypothetical protein